MSMNTLNSLIILFYMVLSLDSSDAYNRCITHLLTIKLFVLLTKTKYLWVYFVTGASSYLFSSNLQDKIFEYHWLRYTILVILVFLLWKLNLKTTPLHIIFNFMYILWATENTNTISNIIFNIHLKWISLIK